MTNGEPTLSRLLIRNFKSIRSADLQLRPLTVFVGENSAGKSSVLQSIFRLAQIVRGRSRPDSVPLNGMELNLGNFAELRHLEATGEDIVLSADVLRRRV